MQLDIIEMMKWLFGIQVGVLVVVFGTIWSRMNKLEDKIDKRFDSIAEKLDKSFEKITDLDRRLFAIETMLHMKDCCMLKDSNQMKKVD